MRLSNFIRDNRKAITQEWQDYARTLRPSAGMSDLQLKDHIDEILTFVADDIETAQSPNEQVKKSQGRQAGQAETETAAETHAALRRTDGFDIIEMVAEYRALRATVTKLWARKRGALDERDIMDLGRFNEAIDQALAESVVRFTEDVNKAKNLLLGVLGHDIRSPVGAILMASALVSKTGPVNEKQSMLLEQIKVSADRVQVIVMDLLDLAKAGAGQNLPVKKTVCSLSNVCHQIVDEMRVRHPERAISLIVPDEIVGEWDETRLGQLLSNLVANAIQYGDPDRPVAVTVRNEKNDVVLTVMNHGVPIPATHLDAIFQSFSRVPSSPEEREIPTSNLGLGLFISKEIVEAHNGSISVVSDAESGTTFSVCLPKSA